jgi:hypothetical protein
MKSEYTAKSVYDKSESLRSSLQFNTAAVGKELAAGFAKSVDSFRVFMINSTAGLSTAVGATFTAVDSIVPVTGERAGDNACATNISLGQLNSANLKSKYEAQAELLGYLKLRDGWDGEGSVAPTKSKIADAYSFVLGLPEAFPMPEPTVFNDGEIAWYWENGENLLSITFFGDGNKAYYGNVRNKVYRSDKKQTFSAVDQELLTAIVSI